MDKEQRKLLALEPIIWNGDLSDDCTALWAGLVLRAEWMEKKLWWWRVYDEELAVEIVDCSNNYHEQFIGGDAAREKAESVAREYISYVTLQTTAKVLITDTFKITGRGLVFTAKLIEGSFLTGDIIGFGAGDQLLHRPISGIEDIRKPKRENNQIGLLLKCKNEKEIDRLRKLNPNNQIAVVYKVETSN